MFLKTRMREFFNDKSARPLQIMAGAVAALGLAGGIGILAAENTSSDAEDTSVEKFHFEYHACAANNKPVVLELDTEFKIPLEDAIVVEVMSEKINESVKKTYDEFVETTVKDRLGNEVLGEGSTPSTKIVLFNNKSAAEYAIYKSYNEMGVAVFNLVAVNQSIRPDTSAHKEQCGQDDALVFQARM